MATSSDSQEIIPLSWDEIEKMRKDIVRVTEFVIEINESWHTRNGMMWRKRYGHINKNKAMERAILAYWLSSQGKKWRLYELQKVMTKKDQADLVAKYKNNDGYFENYGES